MIPFSSLFSLCYTCMAEKALLHLTQNFIGQWHLPYTFLVNATGWEG